MKKLDLRLFFSYILACFCLKAAAEAVNSAATVDELDEKVLQMAGFRK